MIRDIHIEGYKGVERADLTDARRINVIVGPNGSGKTSLLEAIFLGAGQSPETLTRVRQWRGRENSMTGDPTQLFEALFGQLFSSAETEFAKVVLTNAENEVRQLDMKRAESLTVVNDEGQVTASNLGVTFEWTGPDGKAEVTPKIVSGGVEIGTVSIKPMKIHFIPARMNVSERETAQTYSRLRVEGDPSEFEKVFYQEFPFLSELAVEAPTGTPSIYARMTGGKKKKLALPEISGGVNHIAGVMVRLATNKKSILLIDEVENGVFHTNYKSMWSAFDKLCEGSDNQIFATTHSLECLEALQEAMSIKARHVRFYRSRLVDGRVEVDQFSGDAGFKALEFGDVR